jgi:hypothetical protein
MSGMDCTYKAGRLQIYRVEASAGHWTWIIAGRWRRLSLPVQVWPIESESRVGVYSTSWLHN